jgi:hypothetical protein
LAFYFFPGRSQINCCHYTLLLTIMVLYRCLCWFLFSETNLHTNQLSLVERHLHDTICTIEQQIEQGQFSGSACRVYELIERCSSSRPVCNFSNFTYLTYCIGVMISMISCLITAFKLETTSVWAYVYYLSSVWSHSCTVSSQNHCVSLAAEAQLTNS